tara:strand:+ start:1512 stop:1697 length:186 start_codon:yes stop_codon:yes gene_type:complete
MNIQNATYKVTNAPNGVEVFKLIQATIDGTEMFVPLDPDNRHYAEIQKQVAAGTLTIEEAD